MIRRYPETLVGSWCDRIASRLPVAAFAGYLFLGMGTGFQIAADEPSPNEPSANAFFTEAVLPILKKHCYECHSHASKEANGGLMLDSRSGWENGGESGPAIAPGKPAESLLIQAVRYSKSKLEMPPTGKLAETEIRVLEQWVQQGAHDPRVPAVAESQNGVDAEKRKSHWAFQPVRISSPPDTKDATWPVTDVDRFLLARLEHAGLTPAPDADRYTWLRRVTLDLTGLPPTPDQIADFVNDLSPQAHERVVDRLLASSAFGERWARHWLDLVGYADQVGTANDVFAEYAWRYRDYVIDALNRDKPIDCFIREQIAGDMLPAASATERAANLVATGFLVLGDIAIVEADKAKLRVDVVDQQVEKVGKAFLGMTLGCARCHDHKFDPVPQLDYYAIAGFFFNTESVFKTERGVWSDVTRVELPETDSQQADRTARVQQHTERLAGMRTEKEQAEKRKGEIDGSLNDTTANRSEDEKKTLQQEREQLNKRINQLKQQIEHSEFFAPAIPRAFSVREVSSPQDMRVTIRGNPYALGEVAPRGFLQVAMRTPTPPIATTESGRRELAEWVASRDNPLTARVTVNRIWQKLFGAGLVRSVDYFGLRGELPSHPELLDFLASSFMHEGWSQKQLIRHLVLSRAYRMNSGDHSLGQTIDPENRLLWRMNRHRLDAEALRDSLLAVSDQLLPSSGGPALPLEYPENVGNLAAKNVNPPSFHLRKFRPEQSFQRTIYLPVIRSGPQPGPAELRNVFDFTQPAEMSGQRTVTAIPTQALFLMNGPLFKDRARDLAVTILGSSQDNAARMELLWLRVLNRPVTADEQSEAIAFLAEVRDNLAHEKPAAAETDAWTELCHALLASNEFLMRL